MGGSSGLIWTSICTGANHACGVRADGALPAGGRIAGAKPTRQRDSPSTGSVRAFVPPWLITSSARFQRRLGIVCGAPPCPPPAPCTPAGPPLVGRGAPDPLRGGRLGHRPAVQHNAFNQKHATADGQPSATACHEGPPSLRLLHEPHRTERPSLCQQHEWEPHLGNPVGSLERRGGCRCSAKCPPEPPRVAVFVTDVFISLTGNGDQRGRSTRPSRTARARLGPSPARSRACPPTPVATDCEPGTQWATRRRVGAVFYNDLILRCVAVRISSAMAAVRDLGQRGGSEAAEASPSTCLPKKCGSPSGRTIEGVLNADLPKERLQACRADAAGKAASQTC